MKNKEEMKRDIMLADLLISIGELIAEFSIKYLDSIFECEEDELMN